MEGVGEENRDAHTPNKKKNPFPESVKMVPTVGKLGGGWEGREMPWLASAFS